MTYIAYGNDEEKERIIGIDESLKEKLIFMGIEEFKKEIIQKKRCFICGAPPKKKGIKKEDAKIFNDEHVIPGWVIRRCNLSNKRITLPNESKLPYTRYTIPCCEECNSKLGRVIEKPISRLFFKENDELLKEPRKKDVNFNLFKWLCLIFIKTHLKDNSLMVAMDEEGASYDWEGLYHIWCVSRSFFTEVILGDGVLGSLIVLECEDIKDHHYDYIDNLANKTIMIKIGKICIIGVLDDAGAVSSILKDTLKRIKGPVTDLQRIEIFSHVNYIKLNLKNLPTFYSTITKEMKYKIDSKQPNEIYLKSEEDSESSVGEFLSFYLEGSLKDSEEGEKILEGIRRGEIGFLFDKKGNFINNSKVK